VNFFAIFGCSAQSELRRNGWR